MHVDAAWPRHVFAHRTDEIHLCGLDAYEAEHVVTEIGIHLPRARDGLQSFAHHISDQLFGRRCAVQAKRMCNLAKRGATPFAVSVDVANETAAIVDQLLYR